MEVENVIVGCTAYFKQVGFDASLKSWHNDPGFILMLWKPGRVPDTTQTHKGDDPNDLYLKAMAELQKRFEENPNYGK